MPDQTHDTLPPAPFPPDDPPQTLATALDDYGSLRAEDAAGLGL
jgi:hypothetical protein